jgi:hypothetical protein
MAKKYFTAVIQSQKHKVFLEDVAVITKRIKKTRPLIPSFYVNTNVEILDIPIPKLIPKYSGDTVDFMDSLN